MRSWRLAVVALVVACLSACSSAGTTEALNSPSVGTTPSTFGRQPTSSTTAKSKSPSTSKSSFAAAGTSTYCKLIPRDAAQTLISQLQRLHYPFDLPPHGSPITTCGGNDIGAQFGGDPNSSMDPLDVVAFAYGVTADYPDGCTFDDKYREGTITHTRLPGVGPAEVLDRAANQSDGPGITVCWATTTGIATVALNAASSRRVAAQHLSPKATELLVTFAASFCASIR